MLIKCPECELQLSDKALSCPHCGYPMTTKTKAVRSNKRMRLPNGFGQITKLSAKNLRNPYRAMITVGKNELGKPICKLLKPVSYFATYNEAYEALIEYNKNPYDISDSLTLKELYDRWSSEYFKTLKNASSERTIKSAWSKCSSIQNLNVKNIRARHIKNCINDADTSAGIKSRMKSLFNLLFDYAVEYEITDRNYARDFKLSSDISKEAESDRTEHIAFNDEEIKLLWQHSSNRIARMILFQIYMGWRPQEVCLLETQNISQDFIIGGMKTDAGKDRKVPIHSCLKDLVKPEGKMLFEKMDYGKYKRGFDNLMSSLNITGHKPHDGRKTFVTLAKKHSVDEYAIKRIAGHAISDITEKIYTERSDEWLINEIEKIKSPC